VVNLKEWRVTTGKSRKGIVFYLLIMALVTLASTYSLVTVILNVIFFFLLWIGLPTFFILDKLLAPFGSMLDEIV